ncbi:MAG TPA: hypothetical protein VEF53_18860 [Patescibacteria group bacterium]|nr:hypothetical protein [Patescibacteria group bacterium]
MTNNEFAKIVLTNLTNAGVEFYYDTRNELVTFNSGNDHIKGMTKINHVKLR